MSQAGVPSTETASELKRLRMQVLTQERRLIRLERGTLRGGVLVTILLLVVGLALPFFVPRSGEGRPATLFAMASPESVSERFEGNAGPGWLIPIVATLIMITVAATLFAGAKPGPMLSVRRFLAYGYLLGCLAGFLVLAQDSESPRFVVASPGLITLTVGAVLAVIMTCAPWLASVNEHAGPLD